MTQANGTSTTIQHELLAQAGTSCAKDIQGDACDWLENLEDDDWADACEEIAAALEASRGGA